MSTLLHTELAAEAAKLNARSWADVSAAIAAAGVPTNEGDAGFPDPFGIGLDADGERVTVNDYVNPPAIIPEIIRDLTVANRGYWIERVYRTPGLTLRSGALLYTETYPDDHFLDKDADVAPRSPGSEAPKIAGKRRKKKMAFPESWSGSIDVTDEARRWNKILEVQDDFRRAANSFAEKLQSSGEAHLSTFAQAAGRFVTGVDGDFSDWTGAPRATTTNSEAPRPSGEFARVQRLFSEDKSGVQPNLVIVSPEDAEQFDRVYEGQAQAVLDRYGLEMLVSVRRPSGKRLYVREGQVGAMTFDVPLGEPEITREGKRKTDVYTMEVSPVFVANGADAILEVRAAA